MNNRFLDDAGDSLAYKEVRSLSRGLAVLRALNELSGGIGTVARLARKTGIHRTTVKRLLETLRAERLVHLKDEGTSYSLGFEVRHLSEGYLSTSWIDQIAAPLMKQHVKSLSWPSDLATPDGGFMIVRESTHRDSLLSQHRATIGIRIPVLVSAIGRAWLAWCNEDTREATLALLRARTDGIGDVARDIGYVRRILRETHKRGYAVNRTEWTAEPYVTAIAMPILDAGYAIGAINLILHRDAVSERKIAAQHVPLLRSLADEISLGVAGMKHK